MKKYENFNKIDDVPFSYDDVWQDETEDSKPWKNPYSEMNGKILDLSILVPSKKKEKKKMDKKIFNVGDIVVCIEIRSKKLSQDAIDFLSTYKYFKILDVNKNYNIDLGYVTSEGSKFYFSPNRFELKDKPKKKSIVPNEEE